MTAGQWLYSMFPIDRPSPRTIALELTARCAAHREGLRGPVNWERLGSSTTATDANEAEAEAKARAAATDGRAVRMEPIRDIQRLPNAPAVYAMYGESGRRQYEAYGEGVPRSGGAVGRRGAGGTYARRLVRGYPACTAVPAGGPAEIGRWLRGPQHHPIRATAGAFAVSQSMRRRGPPGAIH